MKTPGITQRIWRRKVLPQVWRNVTVKRLGALTDSEFLRICGLPEDIEAAAQTLHDRIRHRLFFHPRNRKDFFLNVLSSLQPYDDIIDEADEVVDNKFETLGSGLVNLGGTIDWHRDFKSGFSWPEIVSHRIDLLQLGRPCDVKVPWELSRFHQVWWLGKAYWLTGSERYAEKFQELVESWIAQNPVGIGVNWAVAMEAAIRASNWIAGYSFFCSSKFIPAIFWVRFFKSLYIHGMFIEANLEFARVPGNHFLSDITGLVLLGTLFKDMPFGERWFRSSTHELESEMDRMVYPDGMFYEQSIAYHRLALELFYVPTLLAQLNGHIWSNAFRDRLHKMFLFSAAYQRPDGSTPSFGDADDGRLFRIRRKDDINDHRHALAVGAVMFEDPVLSDASGGFRQDALWLIGGEGFEKFRLIKKSAPKSSSAAFAHAGFYIMRSSDAHVMVDVGDIGGMGKLDHDHCDTLSFEYWVDGAPLIVDSGTFTYTADVEARMQFRSVRFHNTLAVDDEEQVTFKGVWQVNEDTRHPKVVTWMTTAEGDTLTAEHSGYSRLPSPIVHRRSFEFDKRSSALKIVDEAISSGEHRFVLSFHCAPGIVCSTEGERSVRIRRGDKDYRLASSSGKISVEESWYSRSYGVREKSSVVRVYATEKAPWSAIATLEKL